MATATFESRNPATGELIATFDRSSAAEVDSAGTSRSSPT
jgi:hypothetical protein